MGGQQGQQYGQPGQMGGQQYGQPGQMGGQQGQQYGQPGGQMGGQMGGGGLEGQIQAKLQTIIQQNGLSAFYPPQALQQLVQRVARIDMR